MENLKFRLTISGSYTNKAPEYVISLGGEQIITGKIDKPSGIKIIHEFEKNLEENQEYALKVSLHNKNNQTDTIVDDNDQIVSDMLLNIEDLEIDGISLGNLLHTKSRFKFDQPQTVNGTQTHELTNCVNLGFNGTWYLDFSTPFYLWLLENL